MEPKIFAAMSNIMAEVEPIAKGRKNLLQNYQFRGIDDIYNSLNKILAKHGVFTVSTILNHQREERQSNKGGTLIYSILHIRFTFFAVDGSNVNTETIGEGMDSGDKASNKGMSAAHKYALLQAFCIPTDEDKDSENDSPELASQKSKEFEHKQKFVALKKQLVEKKLNGANIEQVKQYFSKSIYAAEVDKLLEAYELVLADIADSQNID